MSTSTGRAVGWLSFLRIIDIPFETCVAALENWQCTEQDSELRMGPSLLRWPLEHDRDSGTCWIAVRLARGLLRPALRMRLNIDRWSWPPARTALELIVVGLDDLAGEVEADSKRERSAGHQLQFAAAGRDISPVDTAGGNTNQDMPRTQPGDRNVSYLEDLGQPIGVVLCRTHLGHRLVIPYRDAGLWAMP